MLWRYAGKLAEEWHSSAQEGGCSQEFQEARPTDSCVHGAGQMLSLHFGNGSLGAWFVCKFSLWMLTFTEQAGVTSELALL